MKQISLIVGIVVSLTLYWCVGYAATVLGTTETPQVTMELQDSQVSKILQNIKQQYGYTVRIQEDLKNEIVSGSFVDVSLEQFFGRLFKHKKNIIVEIDTADKAVAVYQFGKSIAVKGFVKSSSDEKVALSDVTLSELEDILAKENEIDQAMRADPNATLPFSDVTKQEYDEISEREAVGYEEEKQDPTRKLALSDLTQGEVQTILEAEGQRNLADRQDKNRKIALSEMTQGEFEARAETGERIKDGYNQTIPFSTMTYSEFHKLGN
jgi:hypothetical protein